MLLAPPTLLPAAYYQALASLTPLLWIVLVFQAKINQEPRSQRLSKYFGIAILAVQLAGLIGLPVLEWGVLLTLRDQAPLPWVPVLVLPLLTVSAGQAVAPTLWAVVARSLLPEGAHDVVGMVLAAVGAVTAYVWIAVVMINL